MIHLKKTSWAGYALSCLIFACMTSCENPLEKVNPDNDQGMLKIEIGLEMKIITANARLQEINTDDFRVTIKNSNDELYMSFERAADMPVNISIDPGSFYVEVESPNEVFPAFDNPKYYGKSESFTISPNEEKIIDVTASLSNCMVSVTYSQNVLDHFVDYYTVVSNSQGSITFASDETRMGYFGLLPLTIEAYLTRPIGDGSLETKTITGEIMMPAAQTYYEIHINGTIDQGATSINIIADESFITEIIEINDQGVNMNEGAIPFGGLLITEIMYNPSAVSDTEGEWLEIYNNSPVTLDIFQLVIRKGTEVQHIVAENLLIDPQRHLVLARHLNGTSSAHYIYGSDLTLTNSGDELVLANYGNDGTDGQVIALVNYGNTGFPDSDGASLSLDPNAYDVNQAQLGENWCLSTSSFDTGDLGTPGIENDVCN
jgi:hypothetical protein